MPRQAPTYVHRVGRTARAGRGGRSVTLIGEHRRLVMKEVVRAMDKEQRAEIKTRAVLPPVLENFRAKLKALRKDVSALLKEEAALKEMRVAEMHLNRAANVLEHDEEVNCAYLRPFIALFIELFRGNFTAHVLFFYITNQDRVAAHPHLVSELVREGGGCSGVQETGRRGRRVGGGGRWHKSGGRCAEASVRAGRTARQSPEPSRPIQHHAASELARSRINWAFCSTYCTVQ